MRPTPAGAMLRGAWLAIKLGDADFGNDVICVDVDVRKIDALNNGTLTKPHVETLMTVSPRLYEEMIKRVTDFASSGKASLMLLARHRHLINDSSDRKEMRHGKFM